MSEVHSDDTVTVHGTGPGTAPGRIVVTLIVVPGVGRAPLEVLTRCVHAESDAEVERLVASRKLRVWVTPNPRCAGSQPVLARILRHAWCDVVGQAYIDNVEAGYHYFELDMDALGIKDGDEVGIRGELFY